MAASVFMLWLAAEVHAGSYGPQPFTFPTGTTDLGDGTLIASNNGVASIQANALRLTANGTGGTAASFKLPDLDSGREIASFDVTFSVAFSASGQAADGFSINFGNLPGGNGLGENGFAMQQGLTIAWDTYNNGGDPPSIEVFANGASVANFFWNFQFDGFHRDVAIHWDEAGLDMRFGGVVVFNDLSTPGFVPAAGDRFGFTGRTGGLTQNTVIDNLRITTAAVTPIITGGPVITEFVAANDRSLQDEDSNTPDWIEIYNGQSSSVSLAGWTLTNSAASRSLWTFPPVTLGPYQYLVVFASGKNRGVPGLPLHTSFTLQRERGYLALVRPGGTEIASEFNYGDQAADVSYGEMGADRTLGYLMPATPGERNSGIIADGPPAEDVNFSREGGLISGAVTVSIAPPAAAGAVVRYTMDNTPPSAQSALYTTPFNVSGNTTIRARVFVPGQLPGRISSRTFLRLGPTLLNYNNSGQPFSTNLPIVVLDSHAVAVDNLDGVGSRAYRSTYGVVIEPDAITGRAAITDLPQFNGRGATHVRGESSSGFPQRQYSWELRDENDHDKEAPLLGLPADSDWILYAPWSEKTLMRDVLVFGTMNQLRDDYMASRTRFVEVFFNQSGNGSIGYDTTYRGVYVLKEKIKVDNQRLPLAKINDLVSQEPAISGGYIFRKDKADADSTTWTTGSPYNIPLQSFDPDYLTAPQLSYLRGYINRFQSALTGGSFANPETGYAAYMDVDTFIDAQWFVEWTKQVDGYVFSTYFYKDRGGKIRAGPIWDFNISLGNANYSEGQSNGEAQRPTGWNYDNVFNGSNSNGVGQLWYPRLHQDPSYRIRHWDRFWEMRRGVLATNAILGDIDAHANQLLNGMTTPVTNNMPPRPPANENAVMRHYRKYQRLGKYDWPNPSGYQSRIYYNSNGNPGTGEVDYMKNWLRQRLTWLDDANRIGSVVYRPPVLGNGGGNVSAGYELTMQRYMGTAPAGASYANGTLYFTTNGSDPRLPSGGISPAAQRYSEPVSLTESCVVKVRLNSGGNWSPLSSGVFIVDADPASATNLVISELHYNPVKPSTMEVAAGFDAGNYFEFIELMNVSARNVDLSGVTIADAVDFAFVAAPPETLTLPPGGRVLVVGNREAFSMRYGNIPQRNVAGSFTRSLSNDGELLTIRAADGGVIARFTWGDDEPWPVDADGAGYSMVLNNPAANAAYGEGSSWRPSAEIGGAPGMGNSTPYTGSLMMDSDYDGISDYLEYALGSDAADSNSIAAPRIYLAPVDGPDGIRSYLFFEFRRNLAADGVNFTVQISPDATTWRSGPDDVIYVGTTHNGDGSATVVHRSAKPHDAASHQMFMRLRVSP